MNSYEARCNFCDKCIRCDVHVDVSNVNILCYFLRKMRCVCMISAFKYIDYYITVSIYYRSVFLKTNNLVVKWASDTKLFVF